MNISTSWLREWSDPKVSDIDLAEKLTMAGLEVDKIGPVAPDFEGVVVGVVVSRERHPKATHRRNAGNPIYRHNPDGSRVHC